MQIYPHSTPHCIMPLSPAKPEYTQSSGSNGPEPSSNDEDLQILASIASNQKSVPTTAGNTVSFNPVLVSFSAPETRIDHNSNSNAYLNHGQVSGILKPPSHSLYPRNILAPAAVNVTVTPSASAPIINQSHADRRTRNSQDCCVRHHHSSSYRSNRIDFIIFIHVLLKLLRKKRSQSDLFYRTKNVLEECISCHRAGIAGYSPLIEVINTRLRAVDGLASHLRKTEGYFQRYLDKKRVSRSLEPVVQI